MFLDPRGQGGWEWGGVGKVKENRVEVYNEELWSLASRRSVRVKMTSLSWNSVMSGVGGVGEESLSQIPKGHIGLNTTDQVFSMTAQSSNILPCSENL